MKVYISRSSKLIATVIVEGVKKNIPFSFGIPADTRKCAYVRDEATQKALEALPDYGSEFWLLEEVPDEEPQKKEPENTVEPEQVVEPVDEVTGEETPSETGPKDYPEIKSAQKAKLLLVNDLEIATLAECTNAAAIRQIAKSHNITFSNWKE